MTATLLNLPALLFPGHMCAACGDPQADHRIVNPSWNLRPDWSRTVIFRNTRDNKECRFRVTERSDGTWLLNNTHRTTWIRPEDWS